MFAYVGRDAPPHLIPNYPKAILVLATGSMRGSSQDSDMKSGDVQAHMGADYRLVI